MNIKAFGRKEALIIFACFSGIGICYGLQYSFAIFFVEISKHFNADKADTSMIFSLTLLVYGLYAPLIGILTNKFGGRKIFKIASFVIFLGLTGSAFAVNINQLYMTLGIVTALGMNSVGFVPITIIISNNFQEKKGLALGIATTGVGAGAVIITFMAKILIEFFNWKTALALLGIFAFVTIYFVSDFLPLMPKERKFKLNFKFLKNKDFWLIQGGMTCGALTVQSVMLHIVACFLQKGVSSNSAAITVLLIAITGAAGKIFWGFLSDRFKPITLYIFACSLIFCSLGLILQTNAASLSTVIFFSLLFGIGYGSFAPLFPTLAFEKFNDDFGNVMGLLVTGNGIGAFCGTYLMGFMYDITGNYNSGLLFLMAMITVSTGLFILAFMKKKR